jgi:hypothetical protein
MMSPSPNPSVPLCHFPPTERDLYPDYDSKERSQANSNRLCLIVRLLPLWFLEAQQLLHLGHISLLIISHSRVSG